MDHPKAVIVSVY